MTGKQTILTVVPGLFGFLRPVQQTIELPWSPPMSALTPQYAKPRPLVTIRVGTYTTAICERDGKRSQTPWTHDDAFLGELIRYKQGLGWKVLYLVRATPWLDAPLARRKPAPSVDD